MIFFALQFVLIMTNEPHFLFSFFIIVVILCFNAPTQCKVLLLYYYCCRWVDCLRTKCRFRMETYSLDSLYRIFMLKRECTDNLVTIRSSQKRWSPMNIFLRNGFLEFSFYLLRLVCFFYVWDVQVELSVSVLSGRALRWFATTWRARSHKHSRLHTHVNYHFCFMTILKYCPFFYFYLQTCMYVCLHFRVFNYFCNKVKKLWSTVGL